MKPSSQSHRRDLLSVRIRLKPWRVIQKGVKKMKTEDIPVDILSGQEDVRDTVTSDGQTEPIIWGIS